MEVNPYSLKLVLKKRKKEKLQLSLIAIFTTYLASSVKIEMRVFNADKSRYSVEFRVARGGEGHSLLNHRHVPKQNMWDFILVNGLEIQCPPPPPGIPENPPPPAAVLHKSLPEKGVGNQHWVRFFCNVSINDTF